MKNRNEIQQLVAEACDALKASVDIMAEDSLPLEARLRARVKCLEAHARLCCQIVKSTNRLVAIEAASTALPGGRRSHSTKRPAARGGVASARLGGG
jgi:hypothetical protein